MNAITQSPMPLKLFGAVLALALIAAVAVAVTFITGPARSQTPDNAYDDPQPCGPGADTAFMHEPHEVTTGHFALFDAYWENTTDAAQAAGQDSGNTGVLHTNLCPPLVATTTETDRRGNTTTVTTLTASGIDVDEAIIHVMDKHKATVVEGEPNDLSGRHLRLDRYPEVDDYVDADAEVWWLSLDDPATDDVDETSDLTLGFSTKRFDAQYWSKASDPEAAEEEPPFRYKFELERNPGIDPNEHPHFLAYRARQSGAEAVLVWDSAAPDTADMLMQPGELEDLQWVFTKPGTYEISVHLQGYVRQARDWPGEPPTPPDGWAPISGNETQTETSEVKRYLIQVGSPLAENEPPIFGVSLSVPENSIAGTPVGAPIPVFEADAETLYYTLSGDGHKRFTLEPVTDNGVQVTNPHAVQIKVAHGANLDYETKSSYELALAVTDKIDHESNRDLTIDDTLAVAIEITDEFDLSLSADATHVLYYQDVTWTASWNPPLPTDATNVVYHWSMHSNAQGSWVPDPDTQGRTFTTSFSPNGRPSTETIKIKARVYASYTDGNGHNHSTASVESDWSYWNAPS